MVEKKVEDGTEFRESIFRLRTGGMEEILKAMAPGGFCSSGSGRLHRDDDKLFFSFCFNVGSYETGVKAMGVQITIPLTPEEQKVNSEVKSEEA